MPELSDSMVRYLTNVDHHDHEAVVALDPVTREGVGVARYVRPARHERAEAAVTVIDDWQGGRRAAAGAARRPRRRGRHTVPALMLASNDEMMEVLEYLGPVRVIDREAGTVEVEAPLPADGLSAELTS